jgi:hypothetical protein
MNLKASFKLTEWNGEALTAKGRQIARDYAQALSTQFQQEIRDPQWSWPGTTRRRNGSVAGTRRDIVDTGAFAASQRYRTRQLKSGVNISFTWFVDYAGYIRTGTGPKYPGRDWIAKGLAALPFDEFFANNWTATPIRAKRRKRK